MTDQVLGLLHHRQVRLTAGPMARQVRENHRLLLSLDEDALLRPFRVRAGQRAPGSDLGGWYDAGAFAPGGTFGQWVSALSRYFALTGDEHTRNKVHRLVQAYAATIQANGRFYRNNRFPAYIYDKLVGGLVDAHNCTQCTDSLAALQRTTEAALAYLPGAAVPRDEHCKPGEDFSRHAWDESYTLPENQFFAWQVTGHELHRSLAVRFLYDDFFAALAAGDNVLPGKHAYSHVNALSSAAQAYLMLKSSVHLEAARQGFAMIDAQSYATGGWGPGEHFIEPGSGALGASLADQKMSFETPCGAYAHVKLTRYLLRITRDARYGDSMERVLYNTVLGALPLQSDGRAFYYSDYTQTARKDFHPDRWPCCSGSLPLMAADYAISLCFTDALGIYINLYAPAQIRWQQGSTICDLAIATDYPYGGHIAVILKPSRSLRFTVHLRIPGWAVAAQLALNGQRVASPCVPGTFAAIDREWQPGDRLELELSLPLRLVSVDAQHPDTVAVMAGPLVLMRMLGEEPDSSSPRSRAALLSAEPVPGAAHVWQVDTAGAPVTLRPFMDIRNEEYRMYQNVSSVPME